MSKRIRKAWNGGSIEAAMSEAQRRCEEAIASGCPRCSRCYGSGGMDIGAVCGLCGGAGYFVPEGGMPVVTSPAKT